MRTTRKDWLRRRITRLLLAMIGLALTLIFTCAMVMRLSAEVRRLQARRSSLQEAMTIPQIAASFEIPAEVLASHLDLSPEQRQQIQTLTLGQIAAQQGRPFRELARRLRSIIFDYQFHRLPEHPVHIHPEGQRTSAPPRARRPDPPPRSETIARPLAS